MVWRRSLSVDLGSTKKRAAEGGFAHGRSTTSHGRFFLRAFDVQQLPFRYEPHHDHARAVFDVDALQTVFCVVRLSGYGNGGKRFPFGIADCVYRLL